MQDIKFYKLVFPAIIMQDQIYEMLIQKDELTWQTIIYDLVKSEQMDPWDIDISLLSKRYLDAIRELKGHNFFISGKVLLASAILLKIKSDKLLVDYIANFDAALWPQENIDLLEEEKQPAGNVEITALLIKTPQPRKGKVSLNDLMDALQKALNVDKRREIKRTEGSRFIREVQLPEKKMDLTSLIKDIYNKIKGFFTRKEILTFTQLIPSERKEDKILTFIPLLHLSNQGKVDLEQKEPFGEIYIKEYVE